MTPTSPATLIRSPRPPFVPNGVLTIGPAGSQLSGPASPGSIVVRSGGGSSARVRSHPIDRVLETTEMAVKASSALWVSEREWFVDRYGPGVKYIEFRLKELAVANEIPMIGWSRHRDPKFTDAYEGGAEAPLSGGSTLDSVCE